MRTLIGVLCVVALGAQAHAKETWKTVARGRTQWGDVRKNVTLESNGKDYRLVSRFGGGLIRFGMGYAYARPSRQVVTFKPFQNGVWLPTRGLNDDHVWVLSFKGDRPVLRHLAKPNYAQPDYEYVKGAAATRVLEAPLVNSTKGSYGSTWELRLHGGNLFDVIKGGSREKPSVIPFKLHDIWLDPLQIVKE